MYAMYDEHCMDFSNISRWCTFFKELPPGDVAMVHAEQNSPLLSADLIQKDLFIHATHVPVNFTWIVPFSPKTYIAFRCSLHIDESNMHAIFVAQLILLSLELHMKKNCVCSENFKLYLGEILTSQPQYQCRKKFCSLLSDQPLYKEHFCNNRCIQVDEFEVSYNAWINQH